MTSILADIRSRRLLVAKGLLFLLLGLASAVLVAIRLGDLRQIALLAIAIWAFCRFYYFAFYVLERYAGGGPYPGLLALVRSALRKPSAP